MRRRHAGLELAAAVMVIGVFALAPIPQGSAAHVMVDQRNLSGLPNGFDSCCIRRVISGPRISSPGLAAYAAAKGLEVADRGIFELGGIVSGHTLKHLVAAGGVACLVRLFKVRAIAGAETLVQTPSAPAYWSSGRGAMDAAPVDPA